MAASVVYSTFGGHLVYENRGGIERTYMRDPLGNTIGLMDMSGTRTDSWTYWPYGEVQSHGGSSTTPFTFLGTLGYFVDFLNQLYVRARYFRVDVARWATSDPAWPAQPAYAYATNCPTTAVDPSGFFAWLAVLCAGACGGCLVCLAGLLWQCTSCGTDSQCWIQCVRNIIDNLPTWARWLCSGLCAGCAICLAGPLLIEVWLIGKVSCPFICAGICLSDPDFVGCMEICMPDCLAMG